jgi:hypothetical protein
MASAILIYRADKNGSKFISSINACWDYNNDIDVRETLRKSKVTEINTSNPDSEGAVTITIALEYH